MVTDLLRKFRMIRKIFTQFKFILLYRYECKFLPKTVTLHKWFLTYNIFFLMSAWPFATIRAQPSNQHPEKLFNKGYYLLSVDKELAIDYLTQCIKLDSTFTKAYYHRGISYFKLGQYDSALYDFDKAQQLNPELSIIDMYKGFTYRNRGELDKALNAFSNYIGENPTDTSAYRYILEGKMKYELGDFSGAVEKYSMALRLQPFKEKYHYYRYISLYEAGHYKKALEAVNQLIKANNDFYGYYFYKGQLYYQMKEYGPAVDWFSVAIIKNYSNADSYYYRARSYQALNEYTKALEDYNTAIVLKPEEGTFFSKRGNCKYKMGNKEDACTDWDKAGALGYYEDFDKMKHFCQSLLQGG